jgi:hypothetical protein
MKYRNGNVDNDAIKEQISAFESALDSGDYVYIDVEEVLDMLGYYLDNSQTKKATELLDYALKLHPDDTDLLIEGHTSAWTKMTFRVRRNMQRELQKPTIPMSFS